MSVINNILTVMEEKSVKAIDLCKATGISTGNFSDWKANRAVPKLPAISKIAIYLGVSLNRLTENFDKTEQKNNPTNNDEVWEYREVMRTRPEMKVLFDLTKNATKEDIEFISLMIQKMKRRNDE